MPRYIDADALIDEIKSLQITVTGLRAGRNVLRVLGTEYIKSIRRIVDEQPTADVPVCIIGGEYIPKHFPDLAEKYGLPRKPSQIIQPYQFGHHARKTTCLWFVGDVKPLVPTDIVDPCEILDGGYSVGASANFARDENGKILAWNDPRTAKARSKTFTGIAAAMAEQWGQKELL